MGFVIGEVIKVDFFFPPKSGAIEACGFWRVVSNGEVGDRCERLGN